MKGGKGHQGKTIIVYFYKPKVFTPRSKILIVVPGSGRNANDYRDAWIEPAEAYSWLVLSPSYAESDYDFAAYQMCGVIQNLRFPTGIDPDEAVVTLRDEDIDFEPNLHREEWLFNDFDRLFSDVVAATNSEQTSYDVFGHSAGGQILHRLALFQRESKARRIIACNSGFYTLPDFSVAQPFGLKGTAVTEADLQASFQKELIIGLGALDSSNEAGGIQLHTPLADAQGLSRMDRGRYFFEFSRRKAEEINATFNWRLQIVEDVGHDYRGMSKSLVEQIRR